MNTVISSLKSDGQKERQHDTVGSLRPCGANLHPSSPTGVNRTKPEECSPPVRGWPGGRSMTVLIICVFPARAGMARPFLIPLPFSCCVPRPCGDEPSIQSKASTNEGCSPPTWGWAAFNRARPVATGVFPALAGIGGVGNADTLFIIGVPRPCRAMG